MAATQRTRNKHPHVESTTDVSDAPSRPQDFSQHDFSQHDLRFENLIESAPGAIVVIDSAGMIQRVNLRTEEIFSYKRQDLIGQSVEILLPERFRSQHAAHRKHYFAEPQQRPMGVGRDLAGRRQDGSEFPVEIGLSYASDENGVVGIAFIADITTRKQAEVALEVSRQRLQSTLDNLMEGCQLISFDWRYLYVNDAAVFHSRKTREELIGNTMPEVYPGIEDTELFNVLRISMAERVEQHMLNEFSYPNGMKAWFALSIQPVPEGLFILATDITEQVEAEESIRRLNENLEQRVIERTAQLQQSEEKFAKAFRSSPNGMVISRQSNGTIIDMNDAYCRMTGYNRDELLDHTTLQLDISTPEVRGQLLERMRKQGFLRNAEIQIRTKSSQIVDWLVSLEQIDINAEACLLVVAQDITELKAAETEVRRLNAGLEQRQTELEAVNQELEAFSYSVSHDLRAPLRSLAGFSKILMEKYAAGLDPQAVRYLEYLNADARQMGQLIDDLLAFSRLGRQALQTRRVNPVALVQDVLDDCRDEIEQRSISVSIADLPACKADAALLMQVYANLIANAVKFTRNTADPQINIGFQRADNQLIYFVKDNGAGFDMAYADKLFGVFQRLHLAEEFEGTGVGLAIAQRIIHRHGGRIWTEAKLNEGATFYFTLEEDDTDD